MLTLLSLVTGAAAGVWPLPASMQSGTGTRIVSPALEFRAPFQLGLLNDAFDRYTDIIFSEAKLGRGYSQLLPGADPLLTVNIRVDSQSTRLQLDTKESYNISITTTDATITSPTVFGCLRALETFSQLVTYVAGEDAYKINGLPLTITDSPRFAHRGVVVDTARNFLAPDVIFDVLDAMAFNKLNVFHWHITDSQSFPIESKMYPEITATGAYSKDEVYSQDDVKGIIDYALARGIRVIPEFDMPGHTTSWGLSAKYPNITVCGGATPWAKYCNEPPCGQLDPTSDLAYSVTKGIITEMAKLFSDEFFHLGADEVNVACWESSPKIAKYMKDNGKTATDLFQTFEDQIHSFLQATGKKPMNWEEVITNGTGLNIEKSTVIQVWLGPQNVAAVTNKGYRVVASPFDAWYLDCGTGEWLGGGGKSWCDPYKTWEVVYDYDPQTGIPQAQQPLVIGGEVAMWAETIDGNNIHEKLWMRGSAFAERMWSPMGTKRTSTTTDRLNQFRGTLQARGVVSTPIQPRWCVLNPGKCIWQ